MKKSNSEQEPLMTPEEEVYKYKNLYKGAGHALREIVPLVGIDIKCDYSFDTIIYRARKQHDLLVDIDEYLSCNKLNQRGSILHQTLKEFLKYN